MEFCQNLNAHLFSTTRKKGTKFYFHKYNVICEYHITTNTAFDKWQLITSETEL